jgi:hypothetical protein
LENGQPAPNDPAEALRRAKRAAATANLMQRVLATFRGALELKGGATIRNATAEPVNALAELGGMLDRGAVPSDLGERCRQALAGIGSALAEDLDRLIAGGDASVR